MNPALIIAFIQLAIKSAPTVKKVVVDAKELIVNLFNSGEITKEEQDKLMTWADAHMEATLRGEKPPELEVEP